MPQPVYIDHIADLKTREEYLAAVLQIVDVAIFTVDLETNIVLHCNEKLCTDIEKTNAEIWNRPLAQVFWEELYQVLQKLLEISNHKTAITEIYYWREKSRWGQFAVRKARLAGLPDIAVFSITNITEISRSEFEYHRMAFYDQQLNIPNGLQLEQDVSSLSTYRQVALVHFDLDDFSSVNDVYGWDVGDHVLVQIRNWLLETKIPRESLYRVSDDEFAILVQGHTLEEAKQRALAIRARFLEPWQAYPQSTLTLYCTATVGMMWEDYIGGDIRNRLFRAISAAGAPAGSFTLYNAELDRAIKKKILRRKLLVNCVQQDMLGFIPYYQPIVDPTTGKWMGVEALCRWHYPSAGPVSPAVFIDDLEQLGMIAQLDDWMLETTVRECAAHGFGAKSFILDVNLSPKHLLTSEYQQMVLDVLAKYNFPLENLSLEITESGRFDFSPESLWQLEALRAKGVRIVLDDFGTGYSSFENLTHLPATVLKSEKSFLNGLEQDSYRQYLIRVLLDIAHTAGMEMIAEGVETKAQQQLLAGYGVNYLQGYLFAKPMPIAELIKHKDKFAWQ